MSNDAVNRYAARVLLVIAILSAIALKLSLSSFAAESETYVPEQVIYEIVELL